MGDYQDVGKISSCIGSIRPVLPYLLTHKKKSFLSFVELRKMFKDVCKNMELLPEMLG